MCHDSLFSSLSHHLLHAAAISGAVMAAATLALGLEVFRRLMRRLGASDEILTPVGLAATLLVALDLAVIVLMAGKEAASPVTCLIAG